MLSFRTIYTGLIAFSCLSCLGSIYGETDIQAHKQKFKEDLLNDPSRVKSNFYDVKRVLITVDADDTDYIPKVPHAGELFEDGDQPYQLMHNGVKISKDCYYGCSSWMSDIIYALRGHHEPQEEKLFYEVLKYIPENATMIELGAYWGYYSLWFAHETPGAVNYLIEPNKERLEIGKKNFQLNGKNAFFYQAYAGLNNNDPANTETLETVSIDDFLTRENISHLNILHSDIQGAEFQMLKSCEASIAANKIDFLFISTHGDSIHYDCLDFLHRRNFHIIADHLWSESCSADGLIVARRKDVAGPDHVSIRRYVYPRY